MSYTAKLYTCGTCDYYEGSGSDLEKGYCTYYKQYYYPDDTCDHWRKRANEGCFLTTACCEYKGLPDDCRELTSLRRLRDEYIKKQPYGEELIHTYYDEAPGIVDAIKASSDKDAILSDIYNEVYNIAGLVESGNSEEAVIRYLMMFHRASKLVR